MQINIIDRIGKQSGMDYYHQAFRLQLEKIDGVSVKVISNYDYDGYKALLVNQYKSNILVKVFSFVRNLRTLRKYVARNQNDIFINESFGGIQDYLFNLVCSKADRFVVDVHEAISQRHEKDTFYQLIAKWLYHNLAKTVIIHSKRSQVLLSGLGFAGESFFVPHFRYVFKKNYNIAAVGADILEAVSPDRINVLFFGNMNYNKGIDILISAVNRLDDESAGKLDVIAAGKDVDGSCWTIKNFRESVLHLITRHISDDELNFLFSKVDFIALPYRKTSQSGVLEMALYFHNPILATNLDYFKSLLDAYPSFGLLCGDNEDSFSEALARATSSNRDFFIQEDVDRYENKDENSSFLESFSNYLLSISRAL